MFKIIINYTSNNQKANKEFTLNKSKILIGSSKNCDIVLNDPNISNYHALISIDTKTSSLNKKKCAVKIIDLDSKNGIYYLNEKITNAYIHSDDNFSLGPIVCTLIFEDIKNNDFINIDAHIKESNSAINNLKQANIKKDISANISLVDDEYCDLILKKPDEFSNSLKLFSNLYSEKKYSDLSLYENIDNNIITQKETTYFEIIHMYQGTMIEAKQIKHRKIFISSNNLKDNYINLINIKKDNWILQIKDGKVELNPEFENIEMIAAGKFKITLEDECIYINQKTTKPNIKHRSFFKDISRKNIAYFTSVMLSFFLINFIFYKKPNKIIKEHKAIIYKLVKQFNKSDNKSNGENEKRSRIKALSKKRKKNNIKNNFLARHKKINNKNTQIRKTTLKKKFKLNLKIKISQINKSNLTSKSQRHFRKTRSIASLTSISSNSRESKNLNRNLSSQNVKNYSVGNSNSVRNIKGKSKNLNDNLYSIKKTVILGAIDPELLRIILREYIQQFRRCYERELDKNSNLRGILNLNFRILQDGKASNFKIHSKYTRLSQSGITCMKNVLYSIKFPKPKGGGVVDITQPLNFSSERTKI